ncbi:MAG: MGMT family protein [Oscillibacter sp.]|nr:MGMT family protein [Oscillibacter sp.]
MSVFALFREIVRQVPAGKVATYGQIARLAGMPRCARTVGYAMADCRDPSVPCHRVVDRFGGTKVAFDIHGPGTQRALLEAEGVVFRLDGTVDLETCRWDGKTGGGPLGGSTL